MPVFLALVLRLAGLALLVLAGHALTVNPDWRLAAAVSVSAGGFLWIADVILLAVLRDQRAPRV